MASMNLWNSPRYDCAQRARTYPIDVTYSALRALRPTAGIEEIAHALAPNGDTQSICDFGAGTLRNTLWLLQNTPHNVLAVEFQQLVAGSAELKEAQSFGARFSYLSPKDFRSGPTSDAVLLIDVVSCIPTQSSRLAIMSACKAKVRPGGLVVWATETKTLSDVPHLGDGWAVPVRGKKNTYEFYKRYDLKHIRSLCVDHVGLKEKGRLNIPHHNGIVYERPSV